ncbi:hypothetical protein GCK32_001817 [Trichostrongylus colubriformis]|uniref:Uncharacterized protein n=1 Tax=Trichostrongylus colubriformis TaxID=6319 RepID=A0AAN8FPJ3_TRICO
MTRNRRAIIAMVIGAAVVTLSTIYVVTRYRKRKRRDNIDIPDTVTANEPLRREIEYSHANRLSSEESLTESTETKQDRMVKPPAIGSKELGYPEVALDKVSIIDREKTNPTQDSPTSEKERKYPVVVPKTSVKRVVSKSKKPKSTKTTRFEKMQNEMKAEEDTAKESVKT